MPGRRRPVAVRAHQAAATQPDIDEHDVVVDVELDGGHPHADEVEQSIEYGGCAHGL
jgi:hypothetical protein